MQKLKSNANSTSNGINNSFSKTGSNISHNITTGSNAGINALNRLKAIGGDAGSSIINNFNRSGSSIGQSLSRGSSIGTNALNRIGSISNSVSSTLSNGFSKAGTTLGNSISKGAQVGSAALSKLGSVGKSAVSGIASQFEGLNGVIAGAIGGFGLYEIGQAAWTGATQKQFNQAYLATKMSDSAAKGYVKTINDIVAKVPGDDTFMSTLLSGAVARQTNLSTDQLVNLGNAVADYTITSQAMGKSMIETQMDLKEYIQTGNTSQLERDSILKNQLDTLEDQKTVGDRILALDKALKEEGYKGLSQLDIATIKTEELKGKIQAGLTELGTSALPVVEDIVDGLNKADESTGGLSTKALTIGGIVTAMAAPAILVAQKLNEAYKWARQTIDLGGAGGKSKAMRIGASILVAVTLAYVFTGIMGYSNTEIGKVMKEDMKAEVKKQNTKYLSSGIGKQIVEIPIIGQLVLESFTFGGNLGSIVKNFFKENPIDLSGTLIQFTPTLTIPGGAGMFSGIGNSIASGIVQSILDSLSTNKITLPDLISALGFNGISVPGAGLSNIGTMAAQGFIGGFKTTITTGVTDVWNNLKYLLMTPITGVINIFTGSLSTAYRLGMTVYGYIRRGVSGGIKIATGALSTAYSLAVRVYNYVRAGATGAIRILTGSISSALGMVRNLYNTVRGGASGVISIVKKVTGGGPAGPSNISQSMGSGPFDKLNLNYEAYQGTRHSPFVPGGLSGNCVDMSLGLLSLNGGKGSIIQGTWNGGPHVWYQDPSGRNWDPARKALVGTWNPPARGPNESNNNNYNTVVVEMKDNTIYGERDFTDKIKKIAQNTFYNELEVNQATGH